MKILTCMYGGKHGYIALKIAAKLAKAMNSELTVLYVIERIPERHRTAFHYTVINEEGTTLTEKLEQLPILWEKISKRIYQTLGRYGIKAEIKKLSGKTADVILDESDKGYDLVVVGSTGLRGIERSLFGSISNEVAEYANIPVLVVKKDVKINKILVCTDGSEPAKEAEYLSGFLAKALHAEITLISVAPEYIDKEIAETCDMEGNQFIKEEFGIDVKTICKGGVGVKSVRNAILEEADKYNLVVCGSRGLSRLKRVMMGHVSLNVLERAETNVLIVRNCILYKEWKKEH